MPYISPNINNTMLFIDCPIFANRCFQEILNAFLMLSIYENYGNHKNKYKIILVISQDEFCNYRGTTMNTIFTMIKEMFPIVEILKKKYWSYYYKRRSSI